MGGGGRTYGTAMAGNVADIRGGTTKPKDQNQNFAERKPDAVRMLLVKGTFLQYWLRQILLVANESPYFPQHFVYSICALVAMFFWCINWCHHPNSFLIFVKVDQLHPYIMMQLLRDVPSEVYSAYFPDTVVASNNHSFQVKFWNKYPLFECF